MMLVWFLDDLGIIWVDLGMVLGWFTGLAINWNFGLITEPRILVRSPTATANVAESGGGGASPYGAFK